MFFRKISQQNQIHNARFCRGPVKTGHLSGNRMHKIYAMPCSKSRKIGIFFEKPHLRKERSCLYQGLK
jgi:hypothetical protein